MPNTSKPILRATEEVVHDIMRFTDTGVANDLLDLFEFRLYAQNGLLTEKEKFASYDNESDFIHWELSAMPELLGKLKYDTEEMSKEIGFLYRASSTELYKEVETVLMEYVDRLEFTCGSEEAIVSEVIRKCRTGIIVTYKGGNKVVKKYDINQQEQPCLEFEMYNRIDYYCFMNQLLSEFKKNISPFLRSKLFKLSLSNAPVKAEKPRRYSKEELERLHREKRNNYVVVNEKMQALFRQGRFSEFENYCRDNLMKPVMQKGKLVRDTIIEQQDGRMEWMGIKVGTKTVKLQLLGHFINILMEKGYLRKGQDGKDYAQAFIPYFFDKQMDTKSLCQEIKCHARFETYFTDLRNPSTN